MKDNKKYKYIRILGIVLFIYILSRINLREISLIIKNIDIFYLLISVSALSLTYLIGILKWRILTNSQNLKVPFRFLGRAYFKAFFLGMVTPGRIGEFWRTKYLTDVAEISNGKAFYTVFIDRLIDIIVIIVVSIAGVINFLLFNEMENEWIIIGPILFLSVFIFYFLARKEKSKNLLKFGLKLFIPFSFRSKIDSFFDEFFEGMKKLNLGLFLKLMGYGLFYYLISIFFYYFLALSLGIPISFFHVFLIVAIVWLLLIIPVTILGVGTRDAGYIFFFTILNIKIPLAVAFSTTILIISILSVIPGMILFLRDK